MNQKTNKKQFLKLLNKAISPAEKANTESQKAHRSYGYSGKQTRQHKAGP